MNNMNHRKTLDGKTWGNFRYDAESDTLWWKDEDNALWWRDENGELVIKYESDSPSYKIPYPIDHEFDTVDGAVYWIAHMKITPKVKEQDLKYLAKAFSEILECPGLVGAYHTVHATLAESKKNVMRDSNNSSACDKCNQRFRCLTNNDWSN